MITMTFNSINMKEHHHALHIITTPMVCRDQGYKATLLIESLSIQTVPKKSCQSSDGGVCGKVYHPRPVAQECSKPRTSIHGGYRYIYIYIYFLFILSENIVLDFHNLFLSRMSTLTRHHDQDINRLKRKKKKLWFLTHPIVTGLKR